MELVYLANGHPHYTGCGNHSVKQLEEICSQFSEYCHKQQLMKSQTGKPIKATENKESYV